MSDSSGTSFVSAVVVAAGASTRYGRDKLEEVYFGVPLWRWSLDAFLHHPSISEVILVGSRSLVEGVLQVDGGTTRQDSAGRGVLATSKLADLVLIHDAARPFVTPDLISRVITAGLEFSASYPGVQVTDTIRKVSEQGSETLERSELWGVQTPQAGKRDDLLRAYSATTSLTDDVGALEAIGISAHKVEGDPRNIKVTHLGDLNRPVETRTGIGYDIHRFSTDPKRPLWLGGILFEDDSPGLEGHSDADALLHAIADALLGAANLGDIGVHFKNDDPRWKDKASSHFLAETTSMLRAQNWHITNIDATILAERPKVMHRRGEICHAIAQACGMDATRVSVKATTNEGLGAIGRSEGIAAMATATIIRPI